MRLPVMAAAAFGLAIAGAAGGAARADAQGTASAVRSGLSVETRYYTLPNGLKVVLSRDPSVPTVTVGVYYGIGFRIEPRNRTGFAHLFEHLMFQGSSQRAQGRLRQDRSTIRAA